MMSETNSKDHDFKLSYYNKKMTTVINTVKQDNPTIKLKPKAIVYACERYLELREENIKQQRTIKRLESENMRYANENQGFKTFFAMFYELGKKSTNF